MAASPDPYHLEVVFGKAFLMQLELGDLERAQVFARAFLMQRAGTDAVTA